MVTCSQVEGCGVEKLVCRVTNLWRVNRYDRLSTKAALEAIPGFRWCIIKGCKSGQVHDEGDTVPKFRCVGCKKSHCITHQVAWHKEETCAQYDYRYVSSLCPTLCGKDGRVWLTVMTERIAKSEKQKKAQVEN